MTDSSLNYNPKKSDDFPGTPVLVPKYFGAPRQFYPAINADNPENRSESIISLPFPVCGFLSPPKRNST